VGHELYITEVNDIKKLTYLTIEPTEMYWWSPDSQYIIKDKIDYLIKDEPDAPASKRIDFTIVNINTKEETIYSVPRKSLSYSEGMWYVVKQNNADKVTMVHPQDLSNDDPLLQEGMMLPYQITKNVGKRYYEETEEKEIWIRTKEKDFKILDKVGEVWAELSPKRNRLAISYTETQELGGEEKAKSYVYDLKTNKLYEHDRVGSWSPDGEWLMYSKVSKKFDIIWAKSVEQQIKEGKIHYFDWAEWSGYPIGDIFVVSWDAKNIIQLTKDSEIGKTVTFKDPAIWFNTNKVAFLYLTLQYDKREPVKNDYDILINVVPSWGLKIGEIIFKK
jgi:hypothetical protein